MSRDLLRSTAVDSAALARLLREMAQDLLELARGEEDPEEAGRYEARAVRLTAAAATMSAASTAAARALASEVIAQMEADRVPRVDPVALRAQLHAILGSQGVQ